MSCTVACEDCQPPTTEPTAPPSNPQVDSTSNPPSLDPLLDSSTFTPPLLSEGTQSETPRAVIEFCDKCRWLHRATWTQTELFLTFPPPPPPSDTTSDPSAPSPAGLKAITLVPRNAPETGGRFRVWLMRNPSSTRSSTDEGRNSQVEKKNEKSRGWELVWDRKIEGGFPEMKVLKQRIRNLIAPKQDLGHSDKPGKVGGQ
ncbi:hypothetical protein JCM16303_006189 [Sporobolomyces ruberrimus]